MPSRVPPPAYGAPLDDNAWSDFFELVRQQCNNPQINQLNVDPGVGGVPVGTWSVWKNTTSGQVRVWANDNGVMKSVQLV